MKALFGFIYSFIIMVVSFLYIIVVDSRVTMMDDDPEFYRDIITKYGLLATYPIAGLLIGGVSRWIFLSRGKKIHQRVWYRKLFDSARTGMLIGGTAFVTFSSVVSLWNGVVWDLGTSKDSLVIEVVTWLSFGITCVIAIAAYVAIMEYINRESTPVKCPTCKRPRNGLRYVLEIAMVLAFAWLLSRTKNLGRYDK